MINNATARVQKTESYLNNDEILEQMKLLTVGIADKLKPLLNKADLNSYKHFLYTMYHYTEDSKNKLQYAADMSDDKELKNYFLQMKKEEKGHHLLALRDYEEFGLNLDVNKIPPVVDEFYNFWYKELAQEDANEFIGALYIFESIADLVGYEVGELIKRLNLTKKQSRWLMVHAEADHDHGDMALQMCRNYIDRNPQVMLESAKKAAAYWLNVFEYALNPKLD